MRPHSPRAAVLVALVPVLFGQAPPSRVWTVMTSGSAPIEQSGHEYHTAPGPRVWTVALHPRMVTWYRVQAYAESPNAVTAQLLIAGRPQQPSRRINNLGYATDWIVCTSPAHAPLTLEVRANGPTEWAYGLWVPPTSVPIGPCP